MGGKSTILRQICVNVIMAQMGCFVPASECFISQPIDRIFTRIGASDNILEGKSTFLTELEETATILQQATNRSLVVIDELGRGTSTFDGVAIAGATLDHITNQIGCNCLFATHYHKLCTDENVEKMKNRAVHLFHMECKSNGSEIELTHKFVPGSYPHSQAMHVARIAGIPESILQEAEKVSLEFLNSITGA
jgi:DNA mismatch repair protein MSH6